MFFATSKTDAVKEMMIRGYKRAEARSAINKAVNSNGGYHVFDSRGKLIEIEHIRDNRYAEAFASI
jgi:hypothetical protein